MSYLALMENGRWRVRVWTEDGVVVGYGRTREAAIMEALRGA